MNLLLVLVAALAGGRQAQRFGYPAILAEFAAGIILGPPLLGLLESDEERDLSAHDEVVGLGRVSEPIATNHDTIVVAD